MVRQRNFNREAVVSNQPNCPYDESYFLRGKETGKSLYTDYRWLPTLTIPMVQAIIKHLNIHRGDFILDFGCARGYMVRAFRELGYLAYGFDASEWAIENCDREVKHYLTCNPDGLPHTKRGYDWVIAKDVLEHIEYDSLIRVVDRLKQLVISGVFAIVPLAHSDTYDVPEYERDITHIHRCPLTWWVSHFHQAGWAVDGRYRVPGVKDNYSHYPTGNGFITARRIE